MSQILHKLLEGLGLKFLAVVLGAVAICGLLVIFVLWMLGHPAETFVSN